MNLAELHGLAEMASVHHAKGSVDDGLSALIQAGIEVTALSKASRQLKSCRQKAPSQLITAWHDNGSHGEESPEAPHFI